MHYMRCIIGRFARFASFIMRGTAWRPGPPGGRPTFAPPRQFVEGPRLERANLLPLPAGRALSATVVETPFDMVRRTKQGEEEGTRLSSVANAILLMKT